MDILEKTRGPLVQCTNDSCGLVQRMCETKDVKGRPACKWCGSPVQTYVQKGRPLKGGK